MKGLDRVLSLQAQIDVVDNELRMMRTAMKETKVRVSGDARHPRKDGRVSDTP